MTGSGGRTCGSAHLRLALNNNLGKFVLRPLQSLPKLQLNLTFRKILRAGCPQLFHCK